MIKNKITTLLVVPNTLNYDPTDQCQNYVLIHPQYIIETNKALWGHVCSSIDYAHQDLQYSNHRKEFLDELFGKDQWRFEKYIITDKKEAIRYYKLVNKTNPDCGRDTIGELLRQYKAEGKHI